MKVKIVIFFSYLFLNLIIAPTVISLIDNTQETTFFIDVNEDEENKGYESEKDLNLKLQSLETINYILFSKSCAKKNIKFLSRNYTSEFSKNNTPPPELIL